MSDPNFLEIRIYRMYADKLKSVSAGRIIGQAINLLDQLLESGVEGSLFADAVNDNILELMEIKDAVDAISSAVREGLIKEATNG